METEEVTNEGQNNILLYSLSSILLLITAVIGYVYLNFDIVNKGDLESKYIKTTDVSFSSLPSYIKNDYVQKYIVTQKLNTLNKKIKELSKQEKAVPCIEEIKEEIIPTIEVVESIEIEEIEIKEVETKIEQTIEVKKEIVQKINAKEFDVFKCYDMTDGGFYQSTKSIENLHLFLDEHKNAKYFEIIGVVNKLDFKLLRDSTDTLDKTKINLIENFAQIGLARKRVIEATWNIKTYLGADTTIRVVNYTITSQKKHKGFVVRVYN